ncbi:MAG: flagellar basal body-associated FliL family protein [Desulfovibrionaceae bacterium]|jgi:flagellar FliL protein|nr:flagellar basal body-associated FliL family protein [Desulfovibrionaceae bacterium]
MLFIVPDDTDDFPFGGEEAGKAQLDNEELAGDDAAAPAGGVADDKVELDLEDAPFLEDDEAEAPPPAREEVEAPPPSLDMGGEPRESRLKALLRDKRVLIGGGALLLLLIVGIVLFFVFGSTETPGTGEEPQKKEEPAQPAAEQAKPKEPLKPEEFIVTWDTFWVEHTDKDGKIRFLICKFSAPTLDEKLAWEMRSKKVTLRDAVFYYLRNKDLTFLSDKTNVDALKADLLKVINTHLSNGQLENLLIEEYLVK